MDGSPPGSGRSIRQHRRLSLPRHPRLPPVPGPLGRRPASPLFHRCGDQSRHGARRTAGLRHGHRARGPLHSLVRQAPPQLRVVGRQRRRDLRRRPDVVPLARRAAHPSTDLDPPAQPVRWDRRWRGSVRRQASTLLLSGPRAGRAPHRRAGRISSAPGRWLAVVVSPSGRRVAVTHLSSRQFALYVGTVNRVRCAHPPAAGADQPAVAGAGGLERRRPSGGGQPAHPVAVLRGGRPARAVPAGPVGRADRRGRPRSATWAASVAPASASPPRCSVRRRTTSRRRRTRSTRGWRRASWSACSCSGAVALVWWRRRVRP